MRANESYEKVSTEGLEDTYFEDIDTTLGAQESAWLVHGWYYRYFSSEEAAKEHCGIK